VSRTLLIDDGRLQRELILVGTTLVGRDPECEISHADPRLSRRHAEFRVTPDGVRLRDLGSRNGTHVNGQPIQEVMLTPGDVVQIAHLTLRFNDADTAPTVHMGGGARAVGRASAAATRPVEDDRTRVVAPASQAATAVGVPMPALDDRTRVKQPPPARPAQVPPPSVARYSRPTEAIASSVVEDLGDVMIREAPTPERAIAMPRDLSVYGLAGSRWGRQVLLQGLALGLLVLVLTATPLLAWEMRLYGSSALSSWPVLLPVVAAAAAAGVAVASLIARTTAQGVSTREK
jgi:hypothetical protein